jgi:hypothetical protein
LLTEFAAHSDEHSRAQPHEQTTSQRGFPLLVNGSWATAASAAAEVLRARLEERLAGWRVVLRRQVDETSQILRHLLVGRLAFTPREDGGGRFYDFEGHASVSAILSAIVHPEEW